MHPVLPVWHLVLLVLPVLSVRPAFVPFLAPLLAPFLVPLLVPFLVPLLVPLLVPSLCVPPSIGLVPIALGCVPFAPLVSDPEPPKFETPVHDWHATIAVPF